MFTTTGLNKILASWDIQERLNASDISVMDGNRKSGSVWAVGHNFILKSGSREKLIMNIKVAKALAEQGLLSSLPIATKTGAEYLDGEEAFALFHRIKGHPLPKCERNGPDRVRWGEQYGKSIAKLHTALKEVENEVCPAQSNLYHSVIRWALPNVRMQNKQWQMGLNERFFVDYVDTFGRLFHHLPKQLIHRDPNPSNILFDKGAVSGFIDFDLSEVNIRLWDVCYCATAILSESIDEINDTWLDIARGIFHGYESEHELTVEEKRAVFYVFCSIQMICAAYFQSHDAYKDLAEVNRKMLVFISSNKDQIHQFLI